MVKNPTHKVCKHCGESKEFSEYQKAGRGRWLQPYCKPCDAIRKDEYRVKNYDAIIGKNKEYYKGNKAKILAKSREYVDKNKSIVQIRRKSYTDKNIETIRKRGREYRKLNKEALSAKTKARRAANPEYYKSKSKIIRDSRTIEQIEAKRMYDKEYKKNNKEKLQKWRIDNADKIREQKRIWSNKKASTDVTYRLKRNIRTRIRCALKPTNAYKVDKSEKLLGCSIDYFKKYFSSLFTDGMNWDKFMSADIEIDHIKPCAKFDLTQESEQRSCFHYTNLQPLWWQDNNKKGAS
jgi:hypothetical protein